MVDRMHGLLWARDYFLRTSNFFDHGRVCYLIARIAGGEPESYKRRASKMISEAKLKGQIVVADGCKLYYRFVVPNVQYTPHAVYTHFHKGV